MKCLIVIIVIVIIIIRIRIRIIEDPNQSLASLAPEKDASFNF